MLALTGALAGRWLLRRLQEHPPAGAQRWLRSNHRGEPITLLEGPAAALAAAAVVGLAPLPRAVLPSRVRAAGVVAVLGAGSFGLLDDLAERGSAKGLRGHLGELRRGRVTTGLLKIGGIGGTGLAAAALACRRPGVVDLLGGAATVAGLANLLNLFDLRPGRALKVTLAGGALAATSGGGAGLLAAAAVGPAAGLIGQDLGERSMLGDCGANALGALVGTAVVAGAPPPVRWGVLAGATALILASEKVSFTKVIESTPVLRELDAVGRRPR